MDGAPRLAAVKASRYEHVFDYCHSTVYLLWPTTVGAKVARLENVIS